MKDIPKYIYDSYPDLEREFIQVVAHLKVLRDSRQTVLTPKETEGKIVERTVFRFHVYTQVSLHRVVDLTEGLLEELNKKRIVCAFILLRALYENASVVFEANKRLEPLVKERNFREIYKLIFNLQQGTKLETEIKEFIEKEKDANEEEKELKSVIQAKQILNIMDNISEEEKDHREIYNHLCEYTHPNYDGMMGSYVVVKGKHINQISTANALNNINIGNLFRTLSRTLRLFAEGHDGIIKKLQPISEISKEYKEKNNNS